MDPRGFAPYRWVNAVDLPKPFLYPTQVMVRIRSLNVKGMSMYTYDGRKLCSLEPHTCCCAQKSNHVVLGLSSIDRDNVIQMHPKRVDLSWSQDDVPEV